MKLHTVRTLNDGTTLALLQHPPRLAENGAEVGQAATRHGHYGYQESRSARRRN